MQWSAADRALRWWPFLWLAVAACNVWRAFADLSDGHLWDLWALAWFGSALVGAVGGSRRPLHRWYLAQMAAVTAFAAGARSYYLLTTFGITGESCYRVLAFTTLALAGALLAALTVAVDAHRDYLGES